MALKKGFVQVYTGNGKGKTTAALGLAIRAAGAGLKVYIGQFIKKGCYEELKALKKFKNIKLEQFGSGSFIKQPPHNRDKELTAAGFKKIGKIMKKRLYDILILDEINVALYYKLLELRKVADLLKNKPKDTEVVLTGRYAHPKIMKMADLVSDIREKKHYYKKGVKARKGIEF